MVKVRHGRPAIVRGKREVRPNDDGIPDETYHDLFPEGRMTSEQWANEFVLNVLARRVADAREAGMSVEEIQNGQTS